MGEASCFCVGYIRSIALAFGGALCKSIWVFQFTVYLGNIITR